MPDFITAIMQECLSLRDRSANIGGYEQFGLNSEIYYPTCTCPAYKYGKREINFAGMMYPKPCKHIIEAEASFCGWHELSGPELQTKKGVCPRCGGPTVSVRVAI